MLNYYHLEFLQQLNRSKVRFVVIGGQARFMHQHVPTKDLDVWVEFSETNLEHFCSAFNLWKEIYPNHHMPHVRSISPQMISSNTQIHLPDADVEILTPKNEVLRLDQKNKIDILFSVTDLTFEAAYVESHLNLNSFRYLSLTDLQTSQKDPSA